MNSIRSILVTGGTGTFGAAFVRFLLTIPDLRRICIYSRGEHAQAALRQQLGDNPRLRWFIGDVRDIDRLKRAMSAVDTVVHAAALKRIETGVYCPDEMVKTNVLGAMNIIEAALMTGVKRVVGISSDKAFQPISPYGQSKALAESLFLSANTMHGWHGPRFAVARYGNIWNANGSIVPKWKSLIRDGINELPVSDPECTRFFMHISEAIDLIWKLCLGMGGGELEIPGALPAYRLGDLSFAFREYASDIPSPIAFAPYPLPPWEKLHESMNESLHSNEARRMTVDELLLELKNAQSIRDCQRL